MEEQIYTTGQIAKKFKVPLKDVYNWRSKLNIIGYHLAGSRASGLIKIENDKYGRFGFPESLVKHFPNIPPEKRI